MLPSLLSEQIRVGIDAYLQSTFSLADGPFKNMLLAWLESGQGMKGPYFSFGLPFRAGESKTWFPELALDFAPHKHQELAYRMFDHGADAVIGGHPHVLQGIQMVEGKPIFYSLGNFWFNNEDLYSGMAELDLKIPDAPGGQIELAEAKFIPCTQYKIYASLPESAEEKQEIIDYMGGISTDIWLDEDGVVHPY